MCIWQVWAGSKQRQLKVSTMQLMHQYCPLASVLLGILARVLEPSGMGQHPPSPQTLLGFPYTFGAIALIASSALLGLLVSLSTFLVIGATSPLTYNVVGHFKTVVVFAGGVALFGDPMPVKRITGIGIAVVGIVWYTLCIPASPKGIKSSSHPEKEPLVPSERLVGERRQSDKESGPEDA